MFVDYCLKLVHTSIFKMDILLALRLMRKSHFLCLFHSVIPLHLRCARELKSPVFILAFIMCGMTLPILSTTEPEHTHSEPLLPKASI